MSDIPIRDDLIRSVEKVAQEQNTDVESLVNAWVERQLALVREQKVREESARFRAQHSALLAAFPGEYVAMLNGEVVDHGYDLREVYLRVRERFGDAPVLVAPVTESPIPNYQMRSPRYSGPAA